MQFPSFMQVMLLVHSKFSSFAFGRGQSRVKAEQAITLFQDAAQRLSGDVSQLLRSLPFWQDFFRLYFRSPQLLSESTKRNLDHKFTTYGDKAAEQGMRAFTFVANPSYFHLEGLKPIHDLFYSFTTWSRPIILPDEIHFGEYPTSILISYLLREANAYYPLTEKEAMNSPPHSADVGAGQSACHRLLERKQLLERFVEVLNCFEPEGGREPDIGCL